MDAGWAATELSRFIAMTRLEDVQFEGRVTVESNDMIIPAAQVVRMILDRVLPDWRSQVEENDFYRWEQLREASLQALPLVEREEELREYLGDNTPQLSASHLHRWVWDGARSLWQSGHYGEAVRAASRTVNAEAQNKIGRRDIGETELLQAAFSPNPPNSGEVRLRLGVDDGSKTFKSRHAGAVAFAQGCYGALRNPGSHEVQTELDDDEALEQLAAFSILARWIEQAKVLRP